MHIESHHERVVPLSPEKAGRLLDSLASADDGLWPHHRWPAMRFDRPLGPGATGGHGFVRYRVIRYIPGQRIDFEFDPEIGLVGTHWFIIEPVEGGVRMGHHIVAETKGSMLLAWPLAVRWLHDALVRDALDNASAAAGVPAPRPFSSWVRALRWLLATVQTSSGPVRG